VDDSRSFAGRNENAYKVVSGDFVSTGEGT